MVKMVIDTSVWLDLAQEPKDVALIGIIERLIEDGQLTLVVPKIVVEEFLAGRDRVAMEHGKRLSSHFRTVKEAVGVSVAQSDERERTLQFLQRVEQDGPARTKLAAQTFKRIERLLSKSPLFQPSEAVKLAVYQRAIEKLAPFHSGENEAADAAIIEIYAEGVRADATDSSQRWIFVTHDTHFGLDKGNKKTPHPDLACFSPGKSEYFINLPDALRSVEPTKVTQLLHTWELEQPTVAELIDRYAEITAKSDEPHTTRYYKLMQLKGLPIGSKVAAKLQAKDLLDHCRSRKAADIEPTTIRLDLGDLRFLLNTAENDWGVLGVSTDAVDEALIEAEKLGLAGNFYVLSGRRPTSDEIAKLLDYFRKQEKGGKAEIRMADVMEFALASGRRIKEITSLRWSGFNAADGTCKIGGRTVPLLDEAVAIIKRQPSGDFIFWHRGKSASAAFTRAKRDLGIDGLRFQDLRREAVMRMLASKIPLERIEAVTGLGPMSLRRYRDEFARETGAPVETKTKSVRKIRFMARR